jgi:hypothetical protein
VISNAKNKQNDGSRFSIYTTWNFNKIPKMYSNSWLYVCQKKTEKQDIMVTGFRNANV